MSILSILKMDNKFFPMRALDFGKAPIDMTDYECTILAGIPNAPSVYSLTSNPELAEQRQEYVVQRMVQYGYISEDEAQSILQDQS